MKGIFESVIHYANAEDEATGDAFEVFRFKKVGNRDGEIYVPRQELQNADSLYGMLIRKNAALPLVLDRGNQELVELIRSKPQEKWLFAKEVGFRRDYSGFVMPTEVIGCSKAKRRPLPPQWLNEHHITLSKVGTWESWRDSVGKLSLRSNVAMLAICAAFTAPLLSITRRQSFGVNLFGRTKAGKTTALLAGASVIGLGREADLPNWAATAAAKGEKARIFNDMIFPLNEVGLLGGSKNKAYPEIRETIYRLCEGRERSRHSQSVYSAQAASSEVSTIFFSTAEYSIDEYADFARETRDEGEYARCVDVPVSRPNRYSIIDRFPKKLPATERRRWGEDRVIELRKACEANHGAAFPRYIEFLISSRKTLEAEIAKYLEEIENFERHAEVKGALEHARQNFAHLYVGGRLAIDAGVVPWEPEQLVRALEMCWRRAIDTYGAKGDSLIQAKKALQANLNSDKVKELVPLSTFTTKNADGYYVIEGGVKKYTVHVPAMRKWLDRNSAHFKKLLEWLDADGYLEPRQSKTGNVRTDWAVQTPKWPNGKSVRSIVFRDPFPTVE